MREWEIAELARVQHGVASRDQLDRLGFKPGAIDRRISSGRLHVVHRGVYAVGHELLSRRGWWLAAVLACGSGAVLSHHSAAALWGMRGTSPGSADVSVSGRGRRGCAGVRLHRPRYLEADECTVRDRIPVTMVSRTLLDLAAQLSTSQLARAVEEADRLGLLKLRAAEETCKRHFHRPGIARLRSVLGELAPVPGTRSPLERRFVELCREEGIPEPVVNVEVAGYEVDAFWPAQRLIVELDGHEFHRTRAAFERDRARDGALQGAGYRVIRLTYRRLRDDRRGVVELLRRLLAQP